MLRCVGLGWEGGEVVRPILAVSELWLLALALDATGRKGEEEAKLFRVGTREGGGRARVGEVGSALARL